MRVSVVIPAFNEEGNVGRLIEETFAKVSPEALGEVLAIDDGSDDGTAAEIKALSAGRTVRATWHAPDTDAVAKVDGVDSIDVRGDSVLIHGSDSDAIARYLLNHTTACDLEITSRNLEEAFVALTGDDALTPEGALA